MRCSAPLAATIVCLAACSKDPMVEKRFHFEIVTPTTDRPDLYRDGAIDIAFTPDGSGEYFLIYRDGLVEHRGATHEVIKSRKIDVRQNNECGGLAIALDPQFTQNNLVYVGYCVPDADVDLRSFVWDDTKPEPLPDDELVLIMSWEKGVNDFHNIGDMGWDGDKLWISYGDGNRDLTAPQNTLDLRGKLLRITPNRDGTPGYQVPTDNPFLADDTVADEIVIWGLKSSFRVDFWQGTWVLGEVGLDSYEELNVVTLNEPQPNLGYITCEGPMTLDENHDPTQEPCSLESSPLYHPPELFYPHDPDNKVVTEDLEADPTSTAGFGVTGGVFYNAERAGTMAYEGKMEGWYIYCDNQRHFVRRARLVDGELVDDEHLGHLTDIWSWTIGPDGAIYALAPTRLHRLVFD